MAQSNTISPINPKPSSNPQKLNWLISQGDAAQLYEFLYNMSIDEMIETLHRAGFGCGNSIMLKQTILWSISDELSDRRLAKKTLETKPVPAKVFNAYAERIHHAILEAFKLKNRVQIATVCRRMLLNLDKLKVAKRFPNEQYKSPEYLTALELRITRWLCDYQFHGSLANNKGESPDIPVLHDVLINNSQNRAIKKTSIS